MRCVEPTLLQQHTHVGATYAGPGKTLGYDRDAIGFVEAVAISRAAMFQNRGTQCERTKRSNDSWRIDRLGYHCTHIVGDGRVAHALEILDAIAREEDGKRLDLRRGCSIVERPTLDDAG